MRGALSDPTKPLTGYRILVVEDEYIIAMEAKRWLQTAGAEVVGPVPSVAEALDLIDDDGLSAALLDVNLGYGDQVYPVADKLSAISVPYLFTTGNIEVAWASAYRDRPWLAKPYRETEMVCAVAKLLG